VLALLTLALGLGITTAAPAQAATKTILISNGSVAAVTNAVAGDRVRFKNTSSAGDYFVTGGFTTGAIKPGATSVTSAPLAKGDYSFTVALGGLIPTGSGKVSVAAAVVTTPPPTTTKAPAAPTTAAPSAPGPVAPGTVAPAPGTSVPAVQPPGVLPPAGPVAPAPVNTGGSGGSGVALQPRLDTGSLLLPAPGTTPGGPAPQLAPQAGQSAFPTGDPGTALGGGTGSGTTTGGTQISEQASSITDRLNDPSELRQYGLPAVIGLVLLAGAFSLVLRVLFATTSLREWLRGEVSLHRTA
jgi:hypothetical protein